MQTKSTRIIETGKPENFNAFAPFIAMIKPKFDQEKNLRNWAMK